MLWVGGDSFMRIFIGIASLIRDLLLPPQFLPQLEIPPFSG